MSETGKRRKWTAGEKLTLPKVAKTNRKQITIQ